MQAVQSCTGFVRLLLNSNSKRYCPFTPTPDVPRKRVTNSGRGGLCFRFADVCGSLRKLPKTLQIQQHTTIACILSSSMSVFRSSCLRTNLNGNWLSSMDSASHRSMHCKVAAALQFLAVMRCYTAPPLHYAKLFQHGSERVSSTTPMQQLPKGGRSLEQNGPDHGT